MLRALTLLILLSAPVYATCSKLIDTAGVDTWHCPDTGNAVTNGTDLTSFFTAKSWACGDTIMLYDGVTYRGPETAPASVMLHLKPQTGCFGRLTQIVSSALSEIPANQKERLVNYRSKMPTIEVGGNAAFQINGDAITGDFGLRTNNYAIRGIRITPSAWTVANRIRLAALVFNNEFTWDSDTNMRTYMPKNIEIDRCLFENYAELLYGDPNSTNTNGNAFLRSVSIAIYGPFENLYVHDSHIKLDGYTNEASNARNTDWIDITSITAANPAVASATGLVASLGATYNASCTSGCDGFEGSESSPCYTACRRVIFRGMTGSWAPLNGPRYVRARADGNSVDIIAPSPNRGYYSGTTNYDASSYGSFTATSPQMTSVSLLVDYTIAPGAASTSVRVIDNFLESWAMPIFLGGSDGATIDPAVIQSGSTETSVILDHTRNLSVGEVMVVEVPSGSSYSDYCFSSTSACRSQSDLGTGWVRAGRVTAISGNTVTLEPWGSNGIDGTSLQIGGTAIWKTWNIRGLEVRGNAISRGHLHHNSDAGKGTTEIKKCVNCLFDGNVMGGYLNSSNAMVGNQGGTFFIESSNQGGRDPNYLVYNIRLSNNLGSGQMPDGSASCLWNNAMIGNYVHWHSARTSERIFYEHNVATGCVAPAGSQQTHINLLTGLNSHFKHNTFAPDMAQALDYRFAANSDCVPPGTETFPFFPELGRSYNVGVRDNIIGYGNGAYLGNPDTATCWPTIAADIQKNIIVDTESVGTSTINTAFPNNFPVANYTSFWAGTCAYDSWTNCKLASGNANRGAASDGGDPGADIEQVQDRLYRWSERAGLIESDIPASPQMRNRAGNWTIGSTAASVRFQLYNSLASACTVELFTNRNRATAHADASSAQACNRTSSATSGNTVAYTFGGASALTADTTYFYKITDGTRIMVGEFRTLPAGSGAAVSTFRYSSARTGNVCTDAAMSTSCSSISSAATHSVSVPQGAVRYYQAAGGPVKVLVAR